MIQEVKVDAPHDREEKVSGPVMGYFERCDMKDCEKNSLAQSCRQHDSTTIIWIWLEESII